MVAQYIATKPIIDLFLEVYQRLGLWVINRWWEHKGLRLLGLLEMGGSGGGGCVNGVQEENA